MYSSVSVVTQGCLHPRKMIRKFSQYSTAETFTRNSISTVKIINTLTQDYPVFTHEATTPHSRTYNHAVLERHFLRRRSMKATYLWHSPVNAPVHFRYSHSRCYSRFWARSLINFYLLIEFLHSVNLQFALTATLLPVFSLRTIFALIQDLSWIYSELHLQIF